MFSYVKFSIANVMYIVWATQEKCYMRIKEIVHVTFFV